MRTPAFYTKRPARRGIRIALAVVNIVACLLTLLCAYGGYVNPGVSALPALAAMCFPAAFLLMALLTVVNLIVYTRMAVLDAVCLLCCAGPLYTYCPVNFGTTDAAAKAAADTANSFTLMTYNAYQFDYYSRPYNPSDSNLSISYIEERNPDILVLQEATHLDRLSRWRFDKPQLLAFLERYPYRLLSLKTGLGILSKFPVDSVKVDKTTFHSSHTADFACYTLQVKGRKLYIYNVHLQSIGLTPADKALYRSLMRANIDPSHISRVKNVLIDKLARAFQLRAVQARALRRAVDSIGGNAIICGDFNDIPGSYSTRVARGNFTDAFTHAGNGISITYYPSKFWFRIDHIFYGDSLDVAKVQRDTLRTSDHYPLFATFRWKQ